MAIKLHRKGIALDRNERIKEDENLTMIENEFEVVKQTNESALNYVADKAYAQLVDAAKLDWQAPVNSAAELATVYPNALAGYTVMAKDTGIVHRYDGASWGEIQQIDAGPVNELDSRLTGKLAEKAEERVLPIYAANRGVSHLNTAEENTIALRNAVAEAGSTKRPLVLPFCPPTAYIDINDRIYSADHFLNIRGFGANTRIRQTVFPKGIFWLDGDYCYVGNFHVYGVPYNAFGMGSSHGENAGVAMLGSYSTVENIYGDLLTTIVRSSSEIAEKQIVRNRYFNIESGKSVVFNFVIGHSKDCYYDQIKGSYSNLADTPPHLIYADNFHFPNINLQGGTCQAWDGENSFAFQFKGCIGGNAGKLHSRNCAGSYHIMDCTDFLCDEVVSVDDTWNKPTGQGSLTLDSIVKNVRCHINSVFIRSTVNGAKLLYIDATEDTHIYKMDIEGVTNTSDSIISDLVDVRGTRCTLHNPKVVNAGTVKRRSSIYVGKNLGNEIINPTTAGNTYGLFFDTTNTGVNKLTSYNINQQTNYGEFPLATQKPVKISETSHYIDRGDVVARDIALTTFDANGTKYTTSGAEWIIPAGRLLVQQQNGKIFTGSALSSGVIAYINTGYTNVIFEGTLKYNDWDTVAIKALGRYDYLGVRFKHSEGRIYLVSMVNSVLTEESSVVMPVTVGMVYDVKIIVIGNQVKVFLDGVEKTTFTISAGLMTTFGASTNYGIWGRNIEGGKWSNLKWSKA